MKDIIEPAYEIFSTGVSNATRNLRNMEGGVESEVKEQARRKWIYGLAKGNVFPQYDEGLSDANTKAVVWARRSDVNTGDWRLAHYHDRWYIIEKYDNMDYGYIVTKYVKKSEYIKYAKQWEEQYGRSIETEMERYHYEVDNIYRETASYGE